MPYKPYLTDVNTGAKDGEEITEEMPSLISEKNPHHKPNKWDQPLDLRPQQAHVLKKAVSDQQLFAAKGAGAQQAAAANSANGAWGQGRPQFQPQTAPVMSTAVSTEQLFAHEGRRLENVGKNRNCLLLAYAVATKKDHEDMHEIANQHRNKLFSLFQDFGFLKGNCSK